MEVIKKKKTLSVHQDGLQMLLEGSLRDHLQPFEANKEIGPKGNDMLQDITQFIRWPHGR